MRKTFLLVLFIMACISMKAQLQLAKLAGKNGDKYTMGYGGFVKLSYAVTKASDVSLELGVLSFSLKDDSRYGVDLIPLKIGYRYVLTNKSAGPYIEPQLGYNIYGIDAADKSFNGFIWGVGIGYLTKPIGKLRFDIALRYESALHKGGAVNYFMLRLPLGFIIGRRG